MNLVIVESPAKAKTIEKILGKDFQVMSSYGHIRDLKKKDFSIDIENDYSPQYEVSSDKKKLVKTLKDAAHKADAVWLASDEDREGEAISWHLSEVLQLDPSKTKRIVFHEITKPAILSAIESPRQIDLNLVNAQQARRILDRIVGFELSPILWRKIKPSLSAGRVQSVTVRLIVEREKEINDFVSESSFRVQGVFVFENHEARLNAELNTRFATQSDAEKFLNTCKEKTFKVKKVVKKPAKKSPSPPFTTSTLQQEASRMFGFTVSQTMSVAQRLYEAGHITYMRTDSLNLSDVALDATQSLIKSQYGENYSQRRHFQTKSKGAQEAHEAIRPTDISVHSVSGSSQETKLYQLIRKRTIASQMADAELQKTTITVSADAIAEEFLAVGEVVVFAGFLKAYKDLSDNESSEVVENENSLLPKADEGDLLVVDNIIATERYSQRPARFTEASLVRRMEEIGIGRPSTYAPTIQTIQNREYVVKGDKPGEKRKITELSLKDGLINVSEKEETYGADKNRLLPTDIGIVVNDFLTEAFPEILSYHFTADIEKEFDMIALGSQEWTKAIDTFYQLFHPIVEEQKQMKKGSKIGVRLLGTHPKSGLPVYAKIGRFGPIVQIGEATTADGQKAAEKPLFSPLMNGQSLTTITLEEALNLFSLPRVVGTYQEEDMIASEGRFGPYIRYAGKFYSIPKGAEFDARTISEAEAIALIQQKQQAEANKHILSFEQDADLQVLNGRYGPYIKYKKKNFKIPKTVSNPAELSYEECLKIVLGE